MTDFNLLPTDYGSRWKFHWVPIVIVVTAVLCAGGVFAMEWNLHRMRDKSNFIETSQRRTEDLAEFEYLSSRTEDLVERFESINRAVPNHEVWSNVLIELASQTPSGVRMEGLTMNALQGMCKIQGTAEDTQQVLAFKQNLDSLQYFEETKLDTVARKVTARKTPSGPSKEEGKEESPVSAKSETNGVAYEISCRFRKDIR